MAIYAVRYNFHCKAANCHEACITILEAASREQAKQLVIPDRQECLGNECQQQEGHYPQMTFLSVRKLENFCLHGYLEQSKETGFYEFEYELHPDGQEEIEYYHFPEFDLANEEAFRLPESEQRFNRQGAKEVAVGVKLELGRA